MSLRGTAAAFATKQSLNSNNEIAMLTTFARNDASIKQKTSHPSRARGFAVPPYFRDWKLEFGNWRVLIQPPISNFQYPIPSHSLITPSRGFAHRKHSGVDFRIAHYRFSPASDSLQMCKCVLVSVSAFSFRLRAF